LPRGEGQTKDIGSDWTKKIDVTFCVLGFANFNCSGAFCYLGAGSSERMQKPLGAHQWWFGS
jgi:hypothetical protein